MNLNFFKKKTIVDDAHEFEKEYSIAKIISFTYLEVWFKQIFDLPQWKVDFADKPNMATTISGEVVRYLYGDSDSRDISGLKNKEEVELAKRHVEKWADDAMTRDKDFCEFVVQTIRMDSIFNQFFHGTDWVFKDDKGKKIWNVLQKYGDKVPETPDPKKYKKLLNKWMHWDNLTRDKRKIYNDHV